MVIAIRSISIIARNHRHVHLFKAVKLSLGLIIGVVLPINLANAAAISGSPDDLLANLPLAFEKNLGQIDPEVQYVALGSGYRVFLTSENAVVQLFDEEKNSHSIGMKFHGGNKSPKLSGVQELTRKTHYFTGKSRKDDVTNVTNYKRVKYQSVYPGVDVVFYGNSGFLEYDFLLSPNVTPEKLKVEFTGTNGMRLSEEGALILQTEIGEVAYKKPVAYQVIDGKRQIVAAQYELFDKNQVGFSLGKYDSSHPTVIDPILSYSTFVLGGKDIAVDDSGNVYIAGSITSSYDYPLDGYKSKSRGDNSAFIMKLNATATDILYAAYIGARHSTTIAETVGVDAQGNAYIAGRTDSSNYPVTSGAYQTEYSSSSFLTKLNASGDSLVYSTFINGARINDIKVTDSGSVFLTGRKILSSFLTTPGAYNNASGYGVIAKLNAAGNAMDFATNFDQEGMRLAVDTEGNVYVTGEVSYAGVPAINSAQPIYAGGNEVFVSKLNSTGTSLIYSTYLGGAGDEFSGDIAVNESGEAYVVGRTHSNNFPVTPGVFQAGKSSSGDRSDAFVTKLSNSGDALLFSSHLGGNWCEPGHTCFGFSDGDVDHASEVEVDALGYAYIAGYTKSYNFPLVNKLHTIGTDNSTTTQMPFLTKIKPDGNKIVYSWVMGNPGSYAGASGLALDDSGSAYLMGLAGIVVLDDFFPLTGGSPLIDNSYAFAAKISTGRYPTIVVSSNNPANSSQQITFTADVQSSISGGAVTFFADGNELGIAPLENGTAELTTTLPEGGYEITAIYSSDGIASPPIYQVVTGP